jgi:branched-chain amino acid transport system ATP-binding protein
MTEPTPPPAPIIRLDHLTKRFGGVTALDDVSFEIGKGEIHAVVGRTGRGRAR